MLLTCPHSILRTFRQVINITEPKDSLPVSSTSMWSLNKATQQQELRRKCHSAMLPVRPTLKEALDKFEQDFKAANLPEGKYIKPPPPLLSGISWETPLLRRKWKNLNTDFASICISPKPSVAPMGKVPLQVVNEFKHQARQNLCTLNFSAAFNQVFSESNLEKAAEAVSRLLFHSQVVKEGNEFLLKKAPSGLTDISDDGEGGGAIHPKR